MHSDKLTVVHFHWTFLSKTQSFIYHYVSSLAEFRPICLASEFANQDAFPLRKEDQYLTSPRRYSLSWFYDRTVRKFFHIDVTSEKVMRERDVKLIHAHFGDNGVYALRFRRRLGIPLVTTFYGYDVSRLPKLKKWRHSFKSLFQEGDLFLVEGEYMKSSLVKLGCPSEKVKIQRIAIPIADISFSPPAPKKKDEKVIFIFTGRFVEKKGLIYALMAFKAVREKFKCFEFRIIGSGPCQNEIETYIRDNNIQDFVRLLGFLSYEEYLEEMQGADIFIHPSVEARDGDSEGGAPTTILEAQASGMPVLSTYHADIPNIVVPGKSALLSKERDVSGLVENITFLLENQHKWREMGEAGRAFVEQYHDIRNEVKHLEAHYAMLIGVGSEVTC